MTLSAPFDILTGWPGWTLTFEPIWRQEQSRQSNGITRLKDFGSPLWSTSLTTRTLHRKELDILRARLRVLENGEMTFYGYSLSRCWPIAYPKGAWPTGLAFSGLTANLHDINADNKSIKLNQLPVGFVVSVGDFLQIGTGDLYQVVEAAVADGSGLTGYFEVRPHLWPGTATTTAVSVKRPHCLMTVVPGSIQSAASENGLGKISLQATEYR